MNKGLRPRGYLVILCQRSFPPWCCPGDVPASCPPPAGTTGVLPAGTPGQHPPCHPAKQHTQPPRSPHYHGQAAFIAVALGMGSPPPNIYMQGRAVGVRAVAQTPEIPFEHLFRRDFPHLWFSSKQQGGTAWGVGWLCITMGHQPGGIIVGGWWPCDLALGHLGPPAPRDGGWAFPVCWC